MLKSRIQRQPFANRFKSRSAKFKGLFNIKSSTNISIVFLFNLLQFSLAKCTNLIFRLFLATPNEPRDGSGFLRDVFVHGVNRG